MPRSSVTLTADEIALVREALKVAAETYTSAAAHLAKHPDVFPAGRGHQLLMDQADRMLTLRANLKETAEWLKAKGFTLP